LVWLFNLEKRYRLYFIKSQTFEFMPSTHLWRAFIMQKGIVQMEKWIATVLAQSSLLL